MHTGKLLSALLAVGFVSSPAVADDSYFDQAQVLSVTPQTERVNYPTQSCQTETVREISAGGASSPLGAIIGGVAGGLLGSQIGKGNGRVAGAAVGAGVGAVVGDRIGGSQPTARYTPVERCVSVDNWQTVNRGYLVSYRYNGRDYTTVLDHDPGPYMPVRVNVSANGGASGVAYSQPAYGTPAYVVPGHAVTTIQYRQSPRARRGDPRRRYY